MSYTRQVQVQVSGVDNALLRESHFGNEIVNIGRLL